MVIPVLADILNATEKEKVKRIILATFRVIILFSRIDFQQINFLIPLYLIRIYSKSQAPKKLLKLTVYACCSQK